MIGTDLLTAATQTLLASAMASTPAAPQSNAVPFSGIVRSMIEQTSSLDKQADDAVLGLLNGQGVEVHEAMIATQKASMAFDLALQVRNKAVGAYQQMLSMQF